MKHDRGLTVDDILSLELRFELLFQVDANDLIVISYVCPFVCKSRHTPNHLSTKCEIRRLDDLCAIDLLVTLRRQLRDNELALFVEQPESIPFFHNKGGLASCQSSTNCVGCSQSRSPLGILIAIKAPP